MPSEDERLNNLTSFIQRTSANCAFLTPSFARQIKPEQIPTLADLVLGGEAVSQASSKRGHLYCSVSWMATVLQNVLFA